MITLTEDQAKTIMDTMKIAENTAKRLNHAVVLLTRIYSCYPAVFKECILKEDIIELFPDLGKEMGI